MYRIVLPIYAIDSLWGGGNNSLGVSKMEGTHTQKTNDSYLSTLLVDDEKNASSLRMKVSRSLKMVFTNNRIIKRTKDH